MIFNRDRKKDRRTRPPRILRVLFFGLIVAFFGAFFLTSWKEIFSDIDDKVIRAERATRYYTQRVGLTLPGTPDLANLSGRLADQNLKLGAPLFMRIFKRSFELEIWLKRGGTFHHFATYPICGYSGRLGPKYKEGDRQAPEGIYTVAKNQLNPNSRWHRSFNLGYPNAFDRSHGRTGSFLMVHGGCRSIGCYAMTNDVIDEIWTLINASFDNGQRRFQVQAFPFRMSQSAMVRRKTHRQYKFWSELKVGYDLFEKTRIPPTASACRKSYRFKTGRTGSDGSARVRNACPKTSRR